MPSTARPWRASVRSNRTMSGLRMENERAGAAGKSNAQRHDGTGDRWHRHRGPRVSYSPSTILALCSVHAATQPHGRAGLALPHNSLGPCQSANHAAPHTSPLSLVVIIQALSDTATATATAIMVLSTFQIVGYENIKVLPSPKLQDLSTHFTPFQDNDRVSYCYIEEGQAASIRRHADKIGADLQMYPVRTDGNRSAER